MVISALYNYTLLLYLFPLLSVLPCTHVSEDIYAGGYLDALAAPNRV